MAGASFTINLIGWSGSGAVLFRALVRSLDCSQPAHRKNRCPSQRRAPAYSPTSIHGQIPVPAGTNWCSISLSWLSASSLAIRPWRCERYQVACHAVIRASARVYMDSTGSRHAACNARTCCRCDLHDAYGSRVHRRDDTCPGAKRCGKHPWGIFIQIQKEIPGLRG